MWLLSLCEECRSIIVTSVIQLLDFAAHLPCTPLSVNTFWARFGGAVQRSSTRLLESRRWWCTAAIKRIPTWLCSITQSTLNRVTQPARGLCRQFEQQKKHWAIDQSLLLFFFWDFSAFVEVEVHYFKLNTQNDYSFNVCLKDTQQY